MGGSMILRDYQELALKAMISGSKNTLIVCACGSGKTIVFSKAIQHFVEKGLKCLVLAHVGTLVQQASDKLELATGLKCGIFSAGLGRKELKGITVATRQSIIKAENLDFDILFIDEVHRLANPKVESQYSTLIKRVGCRVIGVTATPYRLDNGEIYGKDQWFEQIDYEIGTRDLIDLGYLVDYRHKVTEKINLKGIKKTGADYNQKALGLEMEKPKHLESIKDAINKYAEDRKHIIIFAVTIHHAELIHEMLDNSRIVHSKMKAVDREQALADFDTGNIRYLINVNCLTEGFDSPMIDCVVLARPTMSTALYVQQVGRALRLHADKKDALVLDLAGCYQTHGHVDYPDVQVQMPEGKKKKKKRESKICGDCFELIPSNAQSCPECGYIEPVEEVETVKEVEMVDIDAPKTEDVKNIRAEEYISATGNKCVKLIINWRIKHYYALNQEWVPTKLAQLVNRYSDYNVGTYLNPDRFIKCVNGGFLKVKTIRTKKVKGYERAIGF